MYYASVGLISLIVTVIINFEILKKNTNERSVTKRRYRHFLFSVIVYFVSDILWGYMYDERWLIPTYIDTMAFFVSMAVSVLLWTRFVTTYLDTHGRFSKFLLGGGWLVFTYQVIALVINLFYPIFFGFGEGNEYIPGKARYITLFIQMGLYLGTSIYTLVVAVKTEGDEKSHHRTIGFSGIVMTFFIALQSFFPLMPFYAIGCLFATCMIHSFVYKDETAEMGREIGTAKQMAYRDPLTGVKSKLAYLERLGDLEGRVEAGSLSKYGVVVFDVNGLKKINDTLGHDEGDEYIRSACRLICEQFKHSPVFRIGGDEFVAILEGEDYENREDLLKSFETAVEEYRANGKVVVSSGMAVYQTETDDSYNDVFKRADKKMYERKGYLKGI